MVAIFDEVRLAELVQLDGRQNQVVIVRPIDAEPAPLGLRLERQKGRIEIPITADTADDRVQQDWP